MLTSLFYDLKSQHSKDVNSPRLIYKFTITPIIPGERYLVDINKIILKFIWKVKGNKIDKTNLKKNKQKGFSLYTWDYEYW